MLHSRSVVLKPAEPSTKGLTESDLNYITDDQSGPFYGGAQPQETDSEGELKKSKERTKNIVEDDWAWSSQKVAANKTPLPKESPTEDLAPRPTEAPIVSHAPTDKTQIVFGIEAALLILVLLLAALACFISSKAPNTRKMTWTLASQSLCTFLAYLLFICMKDLERYCVERWSEDTYGLGSSLFLLLDLVIVVYISLFVIRSWPMTLLAIGAFGQFLLSFAIVDTFEIIEHMNIFLEADTFATIAMFVTAVVSIAVFIGLSTSERELIDFALRHSEKCRAFCKCCCCCCFDAEAVNRPSWNEWKKTAVKLEDQLAAVTLGYLVSQTAEWGILQLPEHSGNVNSTMLILVTLILVALTFCIVLLSQQNSQATPSRISTVIVNVCMVTIAWCSFHALEWQFNGGSIGKYFELEPKSYETALLVALTTSAIVLFFYNVLCCYSLEFCASQWNDTLGRNWLAVVFAMGFVMGVSWVVCFVLGIPAMAAHYPESKISPTVPAAILTNLLVLPIWGGVIFPKSVIGKSYESD
jgi:hypothetical protein